MHEPAESWRSIFDDWEHMTFRDDAVRGKDYELLGQQLWMKLLARFGGAPEIPFFQYFEEEAAPAGHAESIQRVAKHDFNPVIVRVTVLHRSDAPLLKSVLVSLFMSVTQFRQHVTSVFRDLNPRFSMFVIDP